MDLIGKNILFLDPPFQLVNRGTFVKQDNRNPSLLIVIMGTEVEAVYLHPRVLKVAINKDVMAKRFHFTSVCSLINIREALIVGRR